MRKPVFGVSDHVLHKPVCMKTEDHFGLRKWRDNAIYAPNTKALNSCAATTQLICVFVSAFAKRLIYI